MSNNRLIKGDCLEELKKLDSNSIDLVFTDMPYGTTDCKWDTTIDLDTMWEELSRVCKDKTPICLTASQPFTSQLVMSKIKMFKCEWIWEKNRGSNFANTKYYPMKEHESVLIFCKKTPNYYMIRQERLNKAPKSSTVTCSKQPRTRTEAYGKVRECYKLDKIVEYPQHKLRVPRSIQKFKCEVGLHPTQKPVSLCEYFVKTYSKEGDTVLDFTMGSGSTGVAAKNLNRNFIGIELDDKYFEIAKERLRT